MLHSAQAAGGRHGPCHMHRKRTAGAWVLRDGDNERTLAAGASRLPSTGMWDDHSTRAEGQAAGVGLRKTEAWVQNYASHVQELERICDNKSHVDMCHRARAAVCPMRECCTMAEAGATAAAVKGERAICGILQHDGSGGVSTEWDRAEHNVDVLKDERLTGRASANRAADGAAGCAAMRHRAREGDFNRVHCRPHAGTCLDWFFSTPEGVVMGEPQSTLGERVSRATAARTAGGTTGRGGIRTGGGGRQS